MGIYVLVIVVAIIACLFQILIVLVQNSKGGGLAANFTSSGQMMGVRKTADFLEKATWTLCAAILALCIVATATIPRGSASGQSRIKSQIDNAIDPNAIPTLPTAVPPSSGTSSSGSDQSKK
ncbi:MAG: preprotein translocase subunit SecG [Bacteroidales bacterium]|jgi:preprotein translocase subunit SecG